MNDDKKNQYINLETLRRDDQRKVMADIRDAGHCPFCMENLEKYHKNPILKEGKFWVITDNQWPYKNIVHQVLAIYKTHINHPRDMDDKASEELFTLFNEICDERGIEGGGIAMRFGESADGNYGSSVLHLHAHLIEPDLKAMEETEAWRFKFGQPKNYKRS